jgi:hypothetical protein
MYFYEFDAKEESWKSRGETELFNRFSTNDDYPFWSADMLNEGMDNLMARTTMGLQFYHIEESTNQLIPKLITIDGRFNDMYGWANPDQVILTGYFYPKTDLLGLLARDQKGTIKFHGVMKDPIINNDPYPLWNLDREVEVPPIWSERSTKIFIADLLKSGQESIIVRTESALGVYHFDSDYVLKSLASLPLERTESERFYFADLGLGSHKNLVHLTENGLFVYQLLSLKDGFVLRSRNPEFSREFGFSSEYYDSVRFVDLDGDKRDEVLFSDYSGVRALSFDAGTLSWQSMMTRSNLLSTQNYADVIGVIPKRGFKTKPLLFMQDGNGQLLWTSITNSNNNGSLPEDQESAIPKVDFQEWLDQEIFRPHFQTTSQLPKVHPTPINSFTVSQKPTLRWSEIFDDSFFKEAVDVGTDRFHFQIPLVEVPISTAFRVQLELIYDAMENDIGG